MTPEQEKAIIAAVRSFRPGAPINVDDVQFAAAVDGHDLSGVRPWEWGPVMNTVCKSADGPYGNHDMRTWIIREGSA
ncbi:hypothetical protein AUQ37_03975 [Candidatus Methanomethylophilus sp. 1R26]|uniref:hypothetical protein n=1 Tax=Candidatus Methanomethylophilus sp. 1R26 TaxID=1769296 RepID=UPI0007370E10|nr:hypothetical protein [Candidatus Methanomethylophilus sp. 1R26]KUE73028.1 hypothetical protein AUQ37_03975 [Candidatus Methanomethylophilus sp. 1R26]